MVLRKSFGWACLSFGLIAVTSACSGDDKDVASLPDPVPGKGALIQVTARSQVGVLLDE